MAFTDKGAKDAKQAQLKADWSALHAQSRKDLIDEHYETYKDVKLPDNLVTPEDYINYVQSMVLGFGKKKGGEKSGQVLETQPKKKCLNCGSTNIIRQRDETINDNVVWTDEYECQNCKTRFNL